jgi:hypothetical protein
VLLVVLGALLLVPGLLAYTGAWRRWSDSTVLHWPFGLAWAGVGLALVGVGGLLWSTSTPVADVLQQVGLAVCVLGIVFAFWLPQFLLPRWYREAKPSARQRRAGR